MDPDTPQTHVHVSLKEKGAETEVTIIHDGWGTGKDWKEAKDWHQRAWTQVVSSLVVTMSGKKYPIAYRTVYFQLKVEDLERAKRFYEEVFGLEVSWYMSPEVGWCELNLPGEGSRLGLNAGGSGGVLTFDVEDLEAAKAYLEGKGLEMSEITDNPDMVSYFNTKDSEGNAIQIVSDPRVSSK
jgi:predicted enzyme related to lactoylglutathione lyase